MGQLKINSFAKIHRWTYEIIQKFGRKMKNFENFFDVYLDTSVIVNNLKKNFKIFHFSAKFLNYLEGPSVDFFKTFNFQLPHACVNWI